MTRKGPQGPTPERLALAAEVKRLREDEGLLYREIMERFGISHSYAEALYSDPDGAKARARKDGYSMPCPGCGAPLSGSDGPSHLPQLCVDCAKKTQHEARYWTAERVIEAFQAFHRETGRHPSAADAGMGLSPSQRPRFSDARIAEMEASQGLLPNPMMVNREFGSWANAVRAAGLEQSRGGSPTHRRLKRPSPEATEVLRVLDAGPLELKEIARRTNRSNRTAGLLLRGLLERGLVERVGHGVYQLVTSIDLKEENVARQFIVLSKSEVHGTWKELDTVEAINSAHAIEKVALAEGEFVAVPLDRWEVRTVAPVTRFAVMEKAPATH